MYLNSFDLVDYQLKNLECAIKSFVLIKKKNIYFTNLFGDGDLKIT